MTTQPLSREKIAQKLTNLIHDADFLVRHRRTDTAFVRERKLPFSHVVLFLLNLVKGSLQDELDRFFQHLSGGDLSEQHVTKAAFCKARQKLKHQAFIELNQTLCQTVTEHSRAGWHGYRICAVDGSTLNLPNRHHLRKHFQADAEHRPQARASQLFDVTHQVTLDARLAPLSVGERTLALQHLPHTREGDLTLYDRGYPAFYLFAAHVQLGRHFCMRSPWNLYNETRDFCLSGDREQWVVIRPSADAVHTCQELDLPTEPIEVRLVRVDLPSGETEILITSVTDLAAEAFQALYHLRWGVEEDYKRIKSRLLVEQFSGHSVEAIQQDFHAKILSKNLAAVLAQAAQPLVDRETLDRRHPYRVNMSQTLSKLKHVLPKWLSGTQPEDYLRRLLQALSKNREPVRPDRQYARKKKPPKMYHACYKPLG